jgi:hypothetical protein
VSRPSGYKPGDWSATCDICGFEFYASQLKKRWDGFMACEQDYETRNPQDLIRGRKEKISPPWTRPEPTEVFRTVSYVSSTVGTQESTVPSGTNNGTL